MPAFAAARSLWFDYAHLRTVLTRSCVDANQRPVPWYTYPAIEYVKQLDFSDARVFEYGAGNSTLFWAAAAREVVSVEDDEGWHEKLRGQLPANCTLLLETDLSAYARTIDRFPGGFDVIVVDGAARGRTRLKCARRAIQHLRPGGMVVLDNSDWLPESTRTLREADLIQVDMTGFIPIGGHTQTTSFFLHRAFRFAPRGARQPLPGPGAVPNVWEHPSTAAPQPAIEIDSEIFGGILREETFVLQSPEGPRRFALIVADDTSIGARCAAILDRDRDRVLISLNDMTPAAATAFAQLDAALRLPWDQFCAAINDNDKKRYRLRPSAEYSAAMPAARVG
jgi:hypothetical protein